MTDEDGATRRRRALIALVPGLIAYSMGQTVLFALAGPVFRDIGLAESDLGIIISAAALVFVVSSALWGRLSDRWGRRNTITLGLAAYGILSLAFVAVLEFGLSGAMPVATVFTGLLVIRLLYAALGAGIQPASVALMADLSSAEDRSAAVALVGAAFGIGMVLGPASAAFLVDFGVLVPLYVIAVFGLLATALALLGLPKKVPKADSADAGGTVSWPVLVPLIASTLLLYVSLSTLQQTLAFNLQDLLRTDSANTARLTGFVFMAIAVATIFMQAVVIQRFKPAPPTLLLWGLVLALLGFGTYIFAVSFVALLLSGLLMGCGFGLLTPGLTAAASLSTGAGEQGRVAGLMQGTMAGGFVIGPLAGTALFEIDRLYAPLLAMAAMVLAAGLLGRWLWIYRLRAADAAG